MKVEKVICMFCDIWGHYSRNQLLIIICDSCSYEQEPELVIERPKVVRKQ